MPNMRTIRLFYRVDRRQIGYIKFIIEAYEGIAVLSTLDSAEGHVVLSVAPGCQAIVEDIMQDLARTIIMEPINEENQ